MTVKSYSQCGEDRIVSFLLGCIGHHAPITYLDLGCAHPISHNNTYLFYEYGSRGVLVEADPKYSELYKQARPADIHESAAIVPEARYTGQSARFYISGDAGWSTIVESHAQLAVAHGKGSTKAIVDVPTTTLHRLVGRHLRNRPLHLLSVDVEGLDIEILQDVGRDGVQPWIIVAENNGGVPVHLETMRQRKYTHWATTNVNSVYVADDVLSQAKF